MRQLFSSVEVAQSAAQYNYAVAVDGKLIGILAFQEAKFDTKIGGQMRHELIYMMADLAIPSGRYRRLSKLIVMASIASELRDDLQERCVREIGWNVTSAFSRHPESMKYRGVFELLSRKEKDGLYVLNYGAQMGQATLQETLKTWLKKHSKQSQPTTT